MAYIGVLRINTDMIEIADIIIIFTLYTLMIAKIIFIKRNPNSIHFSIIFDKNLNIAQLIIDTFKHFFNTIIRRINPTTIWNTCVPLKFMHKHQCNDKKDTMIIFYSFPLIAWRMITSTLNSIFNRFSIVFDVL